MTPQFSEAVEQEIVAEMQYLLGVAEDSANSETAPSEAPSEGASD